MGFDIDHIETVLRKAESKGFVFSAPQSKGSGKLKGLVVLLGWLGADKKHLDKYSDLLLADGYATVRSTCPTSYLFWPTPEPRRQWAYDLLEYVVAIAHDPPIRPVVFYAFSNGGAFIVEQICHVLEKLPEDFPKIPVQAIIFDSAPCYMHVSTSITAVRMGNSAFVQIVLSSVAIMALLMTSIVDTHRPRSFWSTMTTLGPLKDVPTLYLYSEDDQLCDAKKLEELIEIRKSGGKNVTTRKLTPSQHVQHYRIYPKEYREAVLGFLGQALRA